MNNAPIGVYDSGVGGLSVWRVLHSKLPEESLVYLGDGKNCPYGSRSVDEVRGFADEAVRRLTDEGCKMIVVACNTATAAAIEYLRSKYASLPIVGMEPAVKPACLNTRTGVVGVLATERSLAGDMFQHTAQRYAQGVEVITAVGRNFVELVEADKERSAEAEHAVREVLDEMIEKGVDQIVLGCTHYPFLLPVIERVVVGRGVTILDPAPAVARRVAELLDRYDIRAERGNTPKYEFLTFDDEVYRRRLEHKAFAE